MPRDNDQPGFNVPSDLEDPLHSMATPPAIPPIVNGNAVHFQPQVPTTQFGPITQSYIPRYDLPVIDTGGDSSLSRCSNRRGDRVVVNVTGQGIPLYQMNSYALHGGYMMGPQGPMVPAPGYMPGAPMAHMPMPSAGMHSILMPGASMHPMPMPGAGMSGVPMPGNPTPGGQARVHFEPSLGIGLTQSERLAADIEHAMKESCFEPQDFMPVNKDPYKEWWVMEMDGNWGLYQRRQIDKLKHKWCVRDGWFYAKRLEAPPDV
ncbi:hypothetical protein QBC40DRAFT_234186 [Triangularia verruculosa]|uniref:Uncharacterized protein n=1 Tax=Triangularia verruculosa TaxID=2587418 RepID=A0AAN6X9T1_9PEZI|nr:hypothetical protein QBC40DRAFT_234186 [Triangularia verruculosa]